MSVSDKKLGFGKYSNLTWKQLKQTKKDYAIWLLKEGNNFQGPLLGQDKDGSIYHYLTGKPAPYLHYLKSKQPKMQGVLRPKRTEYILEYGGYKAVYYNKAQICQFYGGLLKSGDIQHDAIWALFQIDNELTGDEEISIGFQTGTQCFSFNGRNRSYRKLVDKLGSNPETYLRQRRMTKFKNAARLAISDQISEFRLTNKIFDPEIHIDHANFFSRILYCFCVMEDLKISEVRLAEDKEGSDMFVDKEFMVKWQNYHRLNAVLQPLAGPENIAKQPRRLNWDMYY